MRFPRRRRLPVAVAADLVCHVLLRSGENAVWRDDPDTTAAFEALRRREKDFTHPDKPVLFDDLERGFRQMGLQTPHMYYHSSPGLVLLKARAGILDESLRIR